MEILSKSKFRNQVSIINESQVRFFSAHDAKKTIFLSHKHTDKGLIYNIKRFFSSFGIDIYVDWLDDEQPDRTIGTTGSIIKQKIHECDKFILVGTDDAIKAQWCNWELGIGDEVKFDSQNIAILPLREDDLSWTGTEYMQRFPIIEYSDGYSLKNSAGVIILEGYYVLYPADKNGNCQYYTLKDWLIK